MSAWRRFSLLFSCSSSLSRLMSDASNPPYLACHF
jgi:hypothetical protein